MVDDLIRYNLFSIIPGSETIDSCSRLPTPRKKQRRTKQGPVFAAHYSKKIDPGKNTV